MIVDGVVNPLRLDVFSIGLHLDELGVSVGQNVGDSVIFDVDGIVVPDNNSSEAENDELEGISRDFSGTEENKSFKEVGSLVAVFILDLLHGFVFGEIVIKLVFLLVNVAFDVSLLVIGDHGTVTETIHIFFQILVDGGGIVQFNRAIQFEIDELEKSFVKLQEGHHDFIINIGWQLLSELIRNNPSNSLTLDFSLVVNTLDTQENLSERSGLDDIEIEFLGKSNALIDSIFRDLKHFMSLESTK